MVYFRKRLTLEVLGEINEMIITKAQPRQQEKKNDDDDQDSSNSGTMIIDATCAPSNIRYPQDTSLLSEDVNQQRRSLTRFTHPARV